MSFASRSSRKPQSPDKMTRDYNRTMAFTKVGTAPLHTLTDDMLASIARSHASERDRPKLLAELRAKLAERRAREAAHG